MSKKKFSNKRPARNPSPAKIVVKKHKPKPKVKPQIKKSNKNTLFLISADLDNYDYNLKYSELTWMKDIHKNDDFIVLCQKTNNKKNFLSNPKFKYKHHTAYGSQNHHWFLTKRLWGLPSVYQRICFCTDTTYLNINKIFNSDYRFEHWGKQSKLLHPSIIELNKISPKTDPQDVTMYHAEAGFVLDINTVEKISGALKNKKVLSDRWDSMIGHAMHRLDMKLNDDDGSNIFPFSMTGDDADKIALSKSYGYLKYYEKDRMYTVIKNKRL